MSSHSSHYHPRSETVRHPMDELKRLISSSQVALDQQPPPSMREILTAYRTNGDGDRDMLLAMLNAKTAEDQRLASVTSLQRTMLEIFQNASQVQPIPETNHSYSRAATNGSYHYPTPGFTQSSRPIDPPPPRDRRGGYHRHHRAASRSRSPQRMHPHMPSSRDIRDAPMLHHSHPDHPRKRHRPSHSPHAAPYEASHPSEQFPPSPYSSSDRSDSAEYSPRSRASMTIGSLLSTGPSREMNGDIPSQVRD